jgi:FMN-dependent NADH-azoreductase
MAKRGRPSEQIVEQPKKFTRKYQNADGTDEIWIYDLNKNPTGPISVEIIYPKGFKGNNIKEEKEKEMFLNPATGRYVAKFRAKQLGLIK